MPAYYTAGSTSSSKAQINVGRENKPWSKTLPITPNQLFSTSTVLPLKSTDSSPARSELHFVLRSCRRLTTIDSRWWHLTFQVLSCVALSPNVRFVSYMRLSRSGLLLDLINTLKARAVGNQNRLKRSSRSPVCTSCSAEGKSLGDEDRHTRLSQSASWMAISCISERGISTPVQFCTHGSFRTQAAPRESLRSMGNRKRSDIETFKAEAVCFW